MCLLEQDQVLLMYWRGFNILIFLLTRAMTTTKTPCFDLNAIMPFCVHCLRTRTQTGCVGACYTYVMRALSLCAMRPVHDALWFMEAQKLPYMAVFKTTVPVHFIFWYFRYICITCTLLLLYVLLIVPTGTLHDNNLYAIFPLAADSGQSMLCWIIYIINN